MNNTAVVRLSDMTFILLKNEKMLLALSYRRNAVALVSLLKTLDIDELYLLLEPNIKINTENIVETTIPMWDIGNIVFVLSDSDVNAIKQLSVDTNAKNVFLVNQIFDYGRFSRFPSFRMVKTWNNLYAFLSYENKTLSYIEVSNNLDSILSSKENCHDEVHIIDVDKIKGKFPELAMREAIELASLAPLLYASTNILKVSIETAFNKEEGKATDFGKEEELLLKEDGISDLLGVTTEQKPEEFSNITSKECTKGIKKGNDESKLINRVKKVKTINHAAVLLTPCILILSICVGVSFGSRSFPGYITTLTNELHLITNEIGSLKKQEIFYQNQIEKLNGRQSTALNIFSDLNGIQINGLLGEMRCYSDSVIAVYYLIDSNGIDALVERIKEKYTVSSVSMTDTINLKDNTVSVYSITLH